MFASEAIPTFAICAGKELHKHGHCQSMEANEKERATAAVFEEMNKWSSENLPMGASAEVTDKFVRKGLKAVQHKFRNNPSASQAYGFIDPITILTVISALFSIVGWIVKWWNGTDE